MEKNELYHWGIKGMKWGRRRYQNKDGSLTPEGKKRYGDEADKKEETVEEKRARLLKSTNAEELYKNRGLLSTAEINERLNRIDTEAKLGRVAASSKKSAMDRINKALEVAGKVDEVYKFATESTMGKALQKKLFGKEVIPEFNIDKALSKLDKMSDKQISDLNSRLSNTLKIKENADKLKNPKKDSPTVSIDTLKDMAKNPDKYTEDDLKTGASIVENIGKLQKKYKDEEDDD